MTERAGAITFWESLGPGGRPGFWGPADMRPSRATQTNEAEGQNASTGEPHGPGTTGPDHAHGMVTEWQMDSHPTSHPVIPGTPSQKVQNSERARLRHANKKADEIALSLGGIGRR
jgi:hypothetical protein